MLSPFSVVVEQVYPVLNAKIAKRLAAKDMRQAAIAEFLGITQAMVSRYLEKTYVLPKDLDNALEQTAERLSTSILAKGSRPDIARQVTEETLHLLSGGALDKFLEEKLGVGRAAWRNLPGEKQGKGRARARFLKAVSLLEQTDLSRFLPEIGINLAMAVEEAETKDDIISLPAKLAAVDGRLKAVLEPRFGCSNYLAGMLLDLRRKNGDLGAVMNIQYNDTTRRAFSEAGWKGLPLERLKSYDGGRLDFLLEKAAPGIEPNAYVLGKDALDVVRRVSAL